MKHRLIYAAGVDPQTIMESNLLTDAAPSDPATPTYHHSHHTAALVSAADVEGDHERIVAELADAAPCPKHEGYQHEVSKVLLGRVFAALEGCSAAEHAKRLAGSSAASSEKWCPRSLLVPCIFHTPDIEDADSKTAAKNSALENDYPQPTTAESFSALLSSFSHGLYQQLALSPNTTSFSVGLGASILHEVSKYVPQQAQGGASSGLQTEHLAADSSPMASTGGTTVNAVRVQFVSHVTDIFAGMNDEGNHDGGASEAFAFAPVKPVVSVDDPFFPTAMVPCFDFDRYDPRFRAAAGDEAAASSLSLLGRPHSSSASGSPSLAAAVRTRQFAMLVDDELNAQSAVSSSTNAAAGTSVGGGGRHPPVEVSLPSWSCGEVLLKATAGELAESASAALSKFTHYNMATRRQALWADEGQSTSTGDDQSLLITVKVMTLEGSGDDAFVMSFTVYFVLSSIAGSIMTALKHYCPLRPQCILDIVKATAALTVSGMSERSLGAEGGGGDLAEGYPPGCLQVLGSKRRRVVLLSPYLAFCDDVLDVHRFRLVDSARTARHGFVHPKFVAFWVPLLDDVLSYNIAGMIAVAAGALPEGPEWDASASSSSLAKSTVQRSAGRLAPGTSNASRLSSGDQAKPAAPPMNALNWINETLRSKQRQIYHAEKELVAASAISPLTDGQGAGDSSASLSSRGVPLVRFAPKLAVRAARIATRSSRLISLSKVIAPAYQWLRDALFASASTDHLEQAASGNALRLSASCVGSLPSSVSRLGGALHPSEVKSHSFDALKGFTAFESPRKSISVRQSPMIHNKQQDDESRAGLPMMGESVNSGPVSITENYSLASVTDVRSDVFQSSSPRQQKKDILGASLASNPPAPAGENSILSAVKGAAPDEDRKNEKIVTFAEVGSQTVNETPCASMLPTQVQALEHRQTSPEHHTSLQGGQEMEPKDRNSAAEMTSPQPRMPQPVVGTTSAPQLLSESREMASVDTEVIRHAVEGHDDDNDEEEHQGEIQITTAGDGAEITSLVKAKNNRSSDNKQPPVRPERKRHTDGKKAIETDIEHRSKASKQGVLSSATAVKKDEALPLRSISAFLPIGPHGSLVPQGTPATAAFTKNATSVPAPAASTRAPKRGPPHSASLSLASEPAEIRGGDPALLEQLRFQLQEMQQQLRESEQTALSLRMELAALLADDQKKKNTRNGDVGGAATEHDHGNARHPATEVVASTVLTTAVTKISLPKAAAVGEEHSQPLKKDAPGGFVSVRTKTAAVMTEPEPSKGPDVAPAHALVAPPKPLILTSEAGVNTTPVNNEVDLLLMHALAASCSASSPDHDPTVASTLRSVVRQLEQQLEDVTSAHVSLSRQLHAQLESREEAERQLAAKESQVAQLSRTVSLQEARHAQMLKRFQEQLEVARQIGAVSESQKSPQNGGGQSTTAVASDDATAGEGAISTLSPLPNSEVNDAASLRSQSQPSVHSAAPWYRRRTSATQTDEEDPPQLDAAMVRQHKSQIEQLRKLLAMQESASNEKAAFVDERVERARRREEALFQQKLSTELERVETRAANQRVALEGEIGALTRQLQALQDDKAKLVMCLRGVERARQEEASQFSRTASGMSDDEPRSPSEQPADGRILRQHHHAEIADIRRQLQSAVQQRDQQEMTITDLQTQLFTLKHAMAMLQLELREERRANGHPERGPDNALASLRGASRIVGPAGASGSPAGKSSGAPKPLAPTPTKGGPQSTTSNSSHCVMSAGAGGPLNAFALSYRSDRNNQLLSDLTGSSRAHQQDDRKTGKKESNEELRCVSRYVANEVDMMPPNFISKSRSFETVVAEMVRDVRPAPDVDRKTIAMLRADEPTAVRISVSNAKVTGDLRQRQ
jgi:hypothetical protein